MQSILKNYKANLPLLFTSIFPPLVPLIIGIKKKYSLLWLYVLTGFLFDLLIITLKRISANRHWAANLFVLLEFVLISFYYKKKVFTNTAFFYAFIISLSAFFILNTLSKIFKDLNTFGYSIFLFTFILYGIIGLYLILKEQKIFFIEKSSFFWANAAFILYASGNLLLFLFKDYLHEKNVLAFNFLWTVSFLTLNILKNLLLAISLSSKTS